MSGLREAARQMKAESVRAESVGTGRNGASRHVRAAEAANAYD